ncbi:MAG: NAD(P)/FAD-dependent oxidoreductase [Candidatus Thorarchaeota archaeon]|nr:NAD(P)/FAD-dependent oxidoreductase [Candidatus Thorarchaeota archaeon]
MYDVVVIGAGPAGSTASYYLAKEGLKVCIIDKESFPRDKPCGGGFSTGLIDEFPYLQKRTDDFLKGIAKIGVLHSPNRRVVLQGKVDMALTLRTDFDNVLFECALEQGADSCTKTRAKHVKFHQNYSEVILASGNSIKGTVVLGADGVTSLVAREAGLQRRWPKDNITACRVAEVPATNEEILERYTEDLHYHFFANLGGLPGYGWIFPKRDTINIGLGIVGTHAQGLPRIFNSFVRFLKHERLLMNNADLSSAKGALIPTGGPVKKSFVDNCLLVGDAAGMVSPLTGGGIVFAMRAARIAARVLLSALEHDKLKENSLWRYEQMWQYNFGKDLKEQLIAQKIFTSPFTDLLFEIGKRDEQIQAMVSESMVESSDSELDIKKLIIRSLLVCLRGSLGR